MDAPRVACITPTIEGREHLLAELVSAIKAQTYPVEHFTHLDRDMCWQTGHILNLLLRDVPPEFDWILTFADDDLPYPQLVEKLVDHTADHDIVYAWCDVEGRGDWTPNMPFSEGMVAAGSGIPGCALYRRTLLEELGGWGDEPQTEDGAFFLKAWNAGARFYCVEECLWVYRFLGDNKSLKRRPW